MNIKTNDELKRYIIDNVTYVLTEQGHSITISKQELNTEPKRKATKDEIINSVRTSVKATHDIVMIAVDIDNGSADEMAHRLIDKGVSVLATITGSTHGKGTSTGSLLINVKPAKKNDANKKLVQTIMKGVTVMLKEHPANLENALAGKEYSHADPLATGYNHKNPLNPKFTVKGYITTNKPETLANLAKIARKALKDEFGTSQNVAVDAKFRTIKAFEYVPKLKKLMSKYQSHGEYRGRLVTDETVKPIASAYMSYLKYDKGDNSAYEWAIKTLKDNGLDPEEILNMKRFDKRNVGEVLDVVFHNLSATERQNLTDDKIYRLYEQVTPMRSEEHYKQRDAQAIMSEIHRYHHQFTMLKDELAKAAVELPNMDNMDRWVKDSDGKVTVQPQPEQTREEIDQLIAKIWNDAKTGQDVRIQAGGGSGKTTAMMNYLKQHATYRTIELFVSTVPVYHFYETEWRPVRKDNQKKITIDVPMLGQYPVLLTAKMNTAVDALNDKLGRKLNVAMTTTKIQQTNAFGAIHRKLGDNVIVILDEWTQESANVIELLKNQAHALVLMGDEAQTLAPYETEGGMYKIINDIPTVSINRNWRNPKVIGNYYNGELRRDGLFGAKYWLTEDFNDDLTLQWMINNESVDDHIIITDSYRRAHHLATRAAELRDEDILNVTDNMKVWTGMRVIAHATKDGVYDNGELGIIVSKRINKGILNIELPNRKNADHSDEPVVKRIKAQDYIAHWTPELIKPAMRTQGKEWPHVIVYADGMNPRNLYTAISRLKETDDGNYGIKVVTRRRLWTASRFLRMAIKPEDEQEQKDWWDNQVEKYTKLLSEPEYQYALNNAITTVYEASQRMNHRYNLRKELENQLADDFTLDHVMQLVGLMIVDTEHLFTKRDLRYIEATGESKQGLSYDEVAKTDAFINNHYGIDDAKKKIARRIDKLPVINNDEAIAQLVPLDDIHDDFKPSYIEAALQGLTATEYQPETLTIHGRQQIVRKVKAYGVSDSDLQATIRQTYDEVIAEYGQDTQALHEFRAELSLD